MPSPSLIPQQRIQSSILLIRGHHVLLDEDLASLYGVTTSVLVQALRRNADRFPEDFVFQLTLGEFDAWKKHAGIQKAGRGGRRYPPYAFTEQGVAMLSSVLRSERAVAVNIEIMRTFVKLRGMLASHDDLSRKLAALERKYDGQFKVVFDAIRQLMQPPPQSKRKLGLKQPRS